MTRQNKSRRRVMIRGRRKRSSTIGFGSKRSYHRNQNDHDPDQKDFDKFEILIQENKNLDQKLKIQ